MLSGVDHPAGMPPVVPLTISTACLWCRSNLSDLAGTPTVETLTGMFADVSHADSDHGQLVVAITAFRCEGCTGRPLASTDTSVDGTIGDFCVDCGEHTPAELAIRCDLGTLVERFPADTTHTLHIDDMTITVHVDGFRCPSCLLAPCQFCNADTSVLSWIPNADSLLTCERCHQTADLHPSTTGAQ